MTISNFLSELNKRVSVLGLADAEIAGIGAGHELIPGRTDRHYFVVTLKGNDTTVHSEISIEIDDDEEE